VLPPTCRATGRISHHDPGDISLDAAPDAIHTPT